MELEVERRGQVDNEVWIFFEWCGKVKTCTGELRRSYLGQANLSMSHPEIGPTKTRVVGELEDVRATGPFLFVSSRAANFFDPVNPVLHTSDKSETSIFSDLLSGLQDLSALWELAGSTRSR